MRWIIEGFGSIGGRHFGLLREMGQEVRLVTKRKDAPCKAYESAREAVEDFNPDYYFICNPTASHIKSLNKLIESGFNGICAIEKPLGLDAGECGSKPSFKTVVTYNMRFHPIVEEVKASLDGEAVIAARLSVGQYLPDWRPGRDYRKVYSAIKSQGGGVLRDLSHELDLAQYFCGKARRLTASLGGFSDLEIDSEDWVTVLMEMEGCPSVSVHMDYLDRNAHRDLVLLTNSRTISADLWRNKLEINGEARTFETERNDSFRKQLELLLNKDFDSLCSYDDGMRVMAVISAIERAARNKTWVSVG